MKRKKKTEEMKESVLQKEIVDYIGKEENIVVSCECDLSFGNYRNTLICALKDSFRVLH